jgi:galactose mutarotase-like enzyme
MNRSGIDSRGNRAEVEEPQIAPSRDVRVLENAHIRVEIAPSRGGKLLSLWSKRTETEWLLPPLQPYAKARSSGGFEEWDGGGFDECLPTVSATSTAPDHGEIWRHAWREEPDGDSVTLKIMALGGSIAVTRRAHLEGVSLILDYTIENRADTPRTLLYCAHPLLRVERGDRILLPAEVREVTVENSAGGKLGKRGHRIRWPRAEAGDDLSVVRPPDGLQADKLFAGPLQTGWCALVRPALDEGIELTFSSDVLPYLGLWICRAAWPEHGAAKQYTVAFEPASAPRDSVADAEREGSAWRLAPGERRSWQLRFRVGAQQEIQTNRTSGRADGRA